MAAIKNGKKGKNKVIKYHQGHLSASTLSKEWPSGGRVQVSLTALSSEGTSGSLINAFPCEG